jgi:hypothetical protein
MVSVRMVFWSLSERGPPSVAPNDEPQKSRILRLFCLRLDATTNKAQYHSTPLRRREARLDIRGRKRLWYVIAAEIVAVILIVLLWPHNQTSPLAPETTSSPAATPEAPSQPK